MHGLAAAVNSGQTQPKDKVPRCQTVLPGLSLPRKIPGLGNFSSKVCLLLFLLSLALPGRTAALGNLTVTSAPGQPLTAEVDLVAVKEEEVPSLAVGVVSPESSDAPYRGSSVATFKTAIKQREDGRFHAQITSSRPADAAFSNLLVELSWVSGRVAREYNIPIAGSERSASAPEASGTPVKPIRVFPESLPRAGTMQTGTVAGVENSGSGANGVSGMATGKIRRESNVGDGKGDPVDFPGMEHASGPVRLAPPMDRVTDRQASPGADQMEFGRGERTPDKGGVNAAYIGAVFFLLLVGIGVHLFLSRRSLKLSSGVDKDVLRDLPKFSIHSGTATSVERAEEMAVRQGRVDEAARIAASRAPVEHQTGMSREPVSSAEVGGQAGPVDAVRGIANALDGEASHRPFEALPESGGAEIDPGGGDDWLPARPGEAEPGQNRKEKDRNPHWWVMPSGIDLAWACQEKGEIAAAIRVLEQVLADGDSRQQESARSMLARLRNADTR